MWCLDAFRREGGLGARRCQPKVEMSGTLQSRNVGFIRRHASHRAHDVGRSNLEHAAFTQQQRPCSVRAARPKSLSCPNGIALRNAVASAKPDTMAKHATHPPITATVADALVHVPQPMPFGSVVADIGMTV